MFTYNSTLAPIILKNYGRHFQKLLAQISKIPDEDKQTHYANAIIPLMANVTANREKGADEKHWRDLFMASNYSLKVKAPVLLPQKAVISPPKKNLTYQKKTQKHRCCGQLLAQLIKVILAPHQKEKCSKASIVALTKFVHQVHGKQSLTKILLHIEKVAQEKIPFPHEEIKESCLQTNNNSKEKNRRKRPFPQNRKKT